MERAIFVQLDPATIQEEEYDALNHRKSLDELMDCYLKSVGINSFLILNCVPMADGSIHPDDMKRYQEFSDEIEYRFGHPVACVEKIPGNEALINLVKFHIPIYGKNMNMAFGFVLIKLKAVVLPLVYGQKSLREHR